MFLYAERQRSFCFLSVMDKKAAIRFQENQRLNLANQYYKDTI